MGLTKNPACKQVGFFVIFLSVTTTWHEENLNL